MRINCCSGKNLGWATLVASLLLPWTAYGVTVSVDIINFTFQPSSVNINVGDSVTWTQKDTASHTSTSDTAIWNSPFLSLNETFSQTFDAAGSFPYHCAVHPFMKASVSVQGGSANQPPTVSIASPQNGSNLADPNVTIAATASDLDGSVAKVAFFNGQTLLGTATSSPFQVTVVLAVGVHNLSAQATDNQGATTTSSVVTVNIVLPNTPPTVSITNLTNGASILGLTSLIIQAAASDPDGSVAKVDFFDGQTLLGTATTSPFQVTVTLASGTHNLSAQATDSEGATSTSTVVTVNVGSSNIPPSVTITNPPNNTLFMAPAAITIQANAADADGTIVKVEFFDGQTSVGTVTAPPFQIVTNLAVGIHSLTAQATDNQGLSTMSSAITVAVAPADVPPSVTITSPTNGVVFIAPADLTIEATATDQDGRVVGVEFFDGQTSLGRVNASPFQLQTSMTIGVHNLSAQATDDQGATATSGVVSVTVTASNAPPSITITSPTNGAAFVAPADVTIQATAADPDGSVAKVEFFDGTSSLGVTTNAPYQIIATLAAGTHNLSAQATDNQGTTANSVGVSISVTNLPPPQPTSVYLQHNLVSDLPGQADVTDTNLVNPWGIATSASSPFWISDNHSGLSTLYNSTGGVVSLIVTVPPPAGGQAPAAPTGIVFNGNTNDFLVASNQPARFIFATEDGTISAWNSGAQAVLKIDNSSSNAVYKGLALATNGTNAFLYAADFHNSRVDVFDSAFRPVTPSGGFSDANLPVGYAPFAIHNIGGGLYVTYALQDNDAHDDVAGPGHGFVNVFDSAGAIQKRLVSQSVLNSPWGLAVAPVGFGSFSQALLIGNFGDGMINAFDLGTGALLGHLNDTNGTALSIQGLWGLKFGNGGQGGGALKLYFTAGISGGGSVEDHGLFGSIAVVSPISLTLSAASTNTVALAWSAGVPPFLVQRKALLSDPNWTNALTTTNTTALLPKDNSAAFYRVMDHAQ